MPRVLPDGQSLSPADRDARPESLEGNAPVERPLHPALQSPPRPRRPRVPGPVQGYPGRARLLSAGTLPLRRAQSGAREDGEAAEAVPVEQLPRDSRHRCRATISDLRLGTIVVRQAAPRGTAQVPNIREGGNRGAVAVGALARTGDSRHGGVREQTQARADEEECATRSPARTAARTPGSAGEAAGREGDQHQGAQTGCGSRRARRVWLHAGRDRRAPRDSLHDGQQDR